MEQENRMAELVEPRKENNLHELVYCLYVLDKINMNGIIKLRETLIEKIKKTVEEL